MLSRQDILDIALNAYRNGENDGRDFDGLGDSASCTYFREDNGGNCAIGKVLVHLGYKREDLILADGKDLNHGTGFQRLLVRLPGLLEKINSDPNTIEFCVRLQKAHDNCRAPTVVNALEQCGKCWSLKI